MVSENVEEPGGLPPAAETSSHKKTSYMFFTFWILWNSILIKPYARQLMVNPKPNSKEKVMMVITYVINSFFFFTKKDIERDNMTESCYNMRWKHCLS